MENIKSLIQPVSIGPAIMKSGTDGIPLQRGIDAARRDGATVIWCHNKKGVEDLPNVVELLSKVVDGASGGDLILPDSVDEFHIFNDLSQAAVAL